MSWVYEYMNKIRTSYAPPKSRLIPDASNPVRIKMGKNGGYCVDKDQCGVKAANDIFQAKAKAPKVFK